jgi:aminopeptidase YwaD
MPRHPRLFTLVASLALACGAWHLAADEPPPAETLLDARVLKALDEELSGTAAKDHVSRLAQFHRVPASPGFHQAIEYVMDRAKSYGLRDAHVETFPGDGVTWFGTLHGNRGWRVDAGALDEVSPHPRRIISTDDVRLAVADNSESADVTAALVDVGAGAQPRDYEGKDV